VAAAAILACRPQLFHVVVPGDQEFDERYAGRRYTYLVTSADVQQKLTFSFSNLSIKQNLIKM